MPQVVVIGIALFAGAQLLIAGLTKIAYQGEFRTALLRQRIIPRHLVVAVAYITPLAEFATGLLLVSGYLSPEVLWWAVSCFVALASYNVALYRRRFEGPCFCFSRKAEADSAAATATAVTGGACVVAAITTAQPVPFALSGAIASVVTLAAGITVLRVRRTKLIRAEQAGWRSRGTPPAASSYQSGR